MTANPTDQVPLSTDVPPSSDTPSLQGPLQGDGHGHLTPELAATTARRAGARQLVLTHLARTGDAPAAIAAAGRYFDATHITAAAPGTVICSVTEHG